MDIEIGSNLYSNTDGTVEIEGLPQLQLSIKQPTGSLLVNFALFDETGRLQAKLVDSSLAFNERRAYELSKSTSGLLLTHIASGKVVLQLDVKQPARVIFNLGEFHTIKGHLFQVLPTEWTVDKHRLSGGQTDAQGGAVIIG